MSAPDSRPLIAHILFRLDYGGMENGIVNLVNGLPQNEFRHTIVALSEATQFRERIRRSDVTVHALQKRAGKDFGAYVRLYKLLRQLKPQIVHTRNIGTIDCVFVAWLAGVPVRIHGEHGWDVHDPDGTNRKYALMRRMSNPFIARFITVSRDLRNWLIERVRIDANKVSQICNGVDTSKFYPCNEVSTRASLPLDRFPPGCVVIGSTMRLQLIKDPMNLVRAFIELRRRLRGSKIEARLLVVGDGPLRDAAVRELESAGEYGSAWFPGSRDDVPALLRAMDIYALGSLREGISNTVLEAMATGIPLVVTATGGNVELVAADVVGQLVPVGDSQKLATALLRYVTDAVIRKQHGIAARQRAEREYSLQRMLRDYGELYRSLVPRRA